MDSHMLSLVAQLSNQELLARVTQLAEREREATASLIAHLAELDARRLYLAEGYSSLFTYCTQVLYLSEHAAYGRIEAARAARRFPVVLQMLGEGSVTLTTVGLLASHLTPENHRDLLEMARHQSKRQVEELVARLRPQPPVPSAIRRLPTASQTSASPMALQGAAASPQPTGHEQGVTPVGPPPLAITPPPARPAVVAPLAPERYRVQFTASAETYEKLRLAQALLRHQIPDGELGAIVDRALTALLADLAKTKFAATARPRGSRGTAPGSRHIPAEVRRAVWLRDGGRCAFVGGEGAPLRRAGLPRVPSRRALRRGWRIHGRQHPASVPRPQWLRGRAVLRAAHPRACTGDAGALRAPDRAAAPAGATGSVPPLGPDRVRSRAAPQP